MQPPHGRAAARLRGMESTLAAPSPRIWVDADACPAVIRDILYRAAERTRIEVILVANRWLQTPSSRFIRAMQVAGGPDVADDAIAERVASLIMEVGHSTAPLQTQPSLVGDAMMNGVP